MPPMPETIETYGHRSTRQQMVANRDKEINMSTEKERKARADCAAPRHGAAEPGVACGTLGIAQSEATLICAAASCQAHSAQSLGRHSS
jgi:hypothetical protein